jgi:hypothetical protein
VTKFRLRLSALAGAGLVGLVVASVSVSGTGSVFFSAAPPGQVFEGQRVTIAVGLRPASRSCVLAIRYKGGRTDRRTQPAPKGKASWTLRVPNVPPGTATVTVACAGAGSVKGAMLVQWALQAPKLSIGKHGFTQRANGFGGSDVGYGLALHNDRARFDAVSVSVLVNFVDATNRLLGSAIRSVGRIPAGTTYYVGGKQGIPTQVPVVRLEIVITAATSAQRQVSVAPLISDIRIIQGTGNDMGFVGSVRGQLLSHYQGADMRNADLGLVVLDGQGNILGGGQVGAQGPLSPGSREFFSATGSFNTIPFTKAQAVLVSPVPSFPQPPP